MKPVERWLVIAACVVVGWFYVWTVRSSGEPWTFGKERRDYYNLLIDGYLSGQLHMKVAVPDALLKLENPYDPSTRPEGLGLHDASFYRGRYYIYFGAAPMAVLMLPFRVLTGMDLPLPVAVLVFTYAGFLATVAVWLAIRRRYFPETRTVAVVAGVLVLGLAGLEPVLLRRPDMWELPIAGGYFFAMLSLYCIWRALHSSTRGGRWLIGASLCVGLAIASRPTYLVASPFLVAPLVWWWRAERKLPWRMVLRIVLPLALVGGAMAWHNYARFDDPLEFGQKYQFSLDYESKLPHFRAAYVPFTANAHFFSAARWTPYFPFFQRADLGEAPAGFTMHRGDVYGILTNFPITWLAFLAPLALWRRAADERGRIAAWLASAALLFGLSAGLLLFFFSALARYQMDFGPTFVLLACVGLLSVERWLTEVATVWARGIARTVWMTAAAFSVVFGMLFSLGFDGLLKEENPPLEQSVARRLNRIPAALERLTGVRHGPLELTLRLPAPGEARRETLFTIGDSGQVDRAFVQYTSDNRVQFGIRPHDRPEVLSRSLSLDAHVIHRVRFSLAGLFPPDVHPFLAHETPEDSRRIKRLLGIVVDGEPVLLEHHRTGERPFQKVRLGQDAPVDPAYPRFSGSIVASRRLEETKLLLDPSANFVRLRLAMGSAEGGRGDPLISFGAGNSGVLLGVMRVGPDQVQFLLAGTAGRTATSDTVTLPTGRSVELVVQTEAALNAKPARIYVRLNGQLVWAPEAGPGLLFPAAVTVGRNVMAVPECQPAVRGEIFSTDENARGMDPLFGTGDTLRMKLTLPASRPVGREPLVVTGRTHAGDLLHIEYLDQQTVRFLWDHWGSPGRMSQPLQLEAGRVHELEIGMTSLKLVADADAAVTPSRGRIRVGLNDRVVWEEEGDFFPAEAGELAIGRNAIGGTGSATMFTGDILSVQRVVHE